LAASLTAKSFQEAITVVALYVQTLSEAQLKILDWRTVQNMFTVEAGAFISLNTDAQGIVTNKQYGKNTVTSPVIWGY